jgi:hypothetical protein
MSKGADTHSLHTYTLRSFSLTRLPEIRAKVTRDNGLYRKRTLKIWKIFLRAISSD